MEYKILLQSPHGALWDCDNISAANNGGKNIHNGIPLASRSRFYILDPLFWILPF